MKKRLLVIENVGPNPIVLSNVNASSSAADKPARVNVFHRTWWKEGPHGGRVPGVGPRSYIARDVSFAIGREIAREYNASHEPGFLSDKAELEEV